MVALLGTYRKQLAESSVDFGLERRYDETVVWECLIIQSTNSWFEDSPAVPVGAGVGIVVVDGWVNALTLVIDNINQVLGRILSLTQHKR